MQVLLWAPLTPNHMSSITKAQFDQWCGSTEPTLTTPDDPDGESSRSASSQRLPSPEYLGNSSSSSDIYIYNTHICTQFRGLSSNHKDLLLSLVDFRMNIYEHMIAISTLGRRTRTKCFLVSQPSLPERGLFSALLAPAAMDDFIKCPNSLFQPTKLIMNTRGNYTFFVLQWILALISFHFFTCSALRPPPPPPPPPQPPQPPGAL